MTWKQAVFLILTNAVLSLLISLAVVTGAQRAQERRFAAATEAAQATTAGRPLVTATPLPRPYIYVVRTGDNLTSIAGRFGVPLEELMRINHLTDANLLQVGQELIIPVPEGASFTPPPEPTPASQPATVPPLPTAVEWVPTATPPPLVTKTSTPTFTLVPGMATATTTPVPGGTATPGVGPAKVSIRGTGGAGDLQREAMILVNEGGEDGDLSGWLLLIHGELSFEFPEGFTIPPGGQVSLHTRQGKDTEEDLYWGLDAPLWGEPGIRATLQDGEGAVVALYPP